MNGSRERRILIVEDEMIIAMDIQNTLRTLGYSRTSIAENGEAALLSVTRNLPDLVIMDIGLSGALDGIDAAEQIRSQHADLHIMFLTSYSNVKMKERAEHIRHSGYILKPFTSENLQKALAGVFN